MGPNGTRSMKWRGPATLGDFGGGGRQSDMLIDRQAAAAAVATGGW